MMLGFIVAAYSIVAIAVVMCMLNITRATTLSGKAIGVVILVPLVAASIIALICTYGKEDDGKDSQSLCNSTSLRKVHFDVPHPTRLQTKSEDQVRPIQSTKSTKETKARKDTEIVRYGLASPLDLQLRKHTESEIIMHER